MNSSDESAAPSQHVQPIRGRWRQRKGVALILVVSFIVLLSALVVGFFSRVTTELTGARSYADGVGARQLAESAVSLVMGQIRAATTVPNGCWASQPGMIRVYGNGQTAASKAYRFYKLYSSNNLVVDPTATPFDPTITDPANSKAEVPLGSGGWSAQPAFFTDLNEPADVKDPTNAANTVKRYPIFDPAVARINALGQNTVANANGTWVEGCEIDPTGKVGNSVILNELTDPTTKKLAKAPMPVRWIYVLRDGTLTAPTPLTGKASGTSGLQAIWNNTANAATPSTGIPTRDNPIVGRMGFWTDDDTCKVNVNTAAGSIADEPANPNYLMASKTTPETNPAFIAGSYWDTPRIQTSFDRGHNGPPATFLGGLASSQPVRNEFQRYPGHPATTSLGLVLRGLLPVSAKANLTSEKLYDLTPRLMSGIPVPGDVLPPNSLSKNSQGGSRQLITYGMQLDPTVYGLTPDPPAPMKKTFDTSPTAKPYNQADPTTWSWHLLSSVDEFYYTSKNFPTVTTADGTRTTANAELGGLNLTQDQLASLVDRSRFFLTAHSRSPELNLLGRPRVTIWPVPSVASEGLLLTSTKDPDTGKLGIHNPSDDLLRFCSTVPGTMPVINTAANPYDEPARTGQFIFDRRDPYTSGTTPTGGNNLQADFWRPRNHQIFQYLQDVTSSNNASRGIPGWGGSFEAKYSVAASGRDQILTEIFDYIRTVNLKDTSRDQRIDRAKGRSSVTQPLVGSAESLKAFARYAPRGIVVPTRVAGNSTSGFGRFPTVSEVSLVFYHGGYIYRDKGGKENVAYDYKQVDERFAVKGSPYPLADKFYNTDKNVLIGQLMRAFLVIETFDPMQGYGPVTNFVNKDTYTGQTMNERIVYEITTPPPFTVTTKSGAQPLNLGIGQNSVSLSSGGTWGGRNFGGTEGFFHTLQGKFAIVPSATSYYPFQTRCQDPFQGIRLGMDDTTFDFSGGQMTLNIRYMDNANGQNGLPAHNELVQTLVLNWPKGTGWPVPITEREAGRGTDRSFQQPNPNWRTNLINAYGGTAKYSGEGFRQDLGGFDPQAVAAYDIAIGATSGGSAFDTNSGKQSWDSFCYNAGLALNGVNWLPLTTNAAGNGTGRGYGMPYFLPSRILWAQTHSWSPWAAKDNKGNPAPGDDKHYANRFLQIVQPGDTIRSLVPGGTIAERTDPRTIALTRNVATGVFQAHPDYNKAPDPSNPNLNRRAQTLRRGDSGFYFNPADLVWFGPKATTEATTGSLAALGRTGYMGSSGPDLPKLVTAAQVTKRAADFDTGIGNLPDGAFAGKADEGNLSRSWQDDITKVWHYVEPYFSTWTYDAPGDTYFSPNRQISSAVNFGSLLAPQTQMISAGWTTLLFCPNPAAGGSTAADHHGFANPPDHLLLDLFSMPVVEPYAISEPFSTDGKVNLNYQMVPFSYIERSTALRAALQSLRVTAIPNNFTRTNPNGGVTELKYKGMDNNENLRYLVNRDETLKGFKAVFDQYTTGRPDLGFFKSASQICEMFLYPKGTPVNYTQTISWSSGDSNIRKWWAQCLVTGDNLREKPYSDLYPRVTTKSNTYTVHYRVQSLRQRPFTGIPNSAAETTYYKTWDESRDQVLSEYRGSTTIERYLDPSDSRFYTQTGYNPDKDSLEKAYRFRTIYNKRFSPW